MHRKAEDSDNPEPPSSVDTTCCVVAVCSMYIHLVVQVCLSCQRMLLQVTIPSIKGFVGKTCIEQHVYRESSGRLHVITDFKGMF